MDNLSTPSVAASQTQKEVTINAAKTQIASALSDFLSISLSSGDHTLSATEFTTYMGFATTGNSVSRTLTIPATKRAIFYVENGGSATLSVACGSTVLSVPASAVVFLQTDGTTNGIVSIAPTPVGGEVDVTVAFSGLPNDGQIVPIVFNQSLTLPASLTGSHFYIRTNPTSTMTFALTKNSTSIGSVSFNTSGVGSATFAGSITFAAGDRLIITAPSPPDATGADVSLSFKGSR